MPDDSSAVTSASLLSGSLLPLPVQLAAATARRYPTAWRRMDEARAGRSLKALQPPTWLTHEEFTRALTGIYFRDNGLTDAPPVDHFIDLYTIGTWRVTQGIYAFDPDLQRALTDTTLDVQLPAALLEHLPEWSVYVQTPGLTHFNVAIAGMFAVLFYAPSGQSLQMTLVPEAIRSIDDDLIRLQLMLGDRSIKATLIAGLSTDHERREEWRGYLASIDARGLLPPDLRDSLAAMVSDAQNAFRDDIVAAFVAEVTPFLSLLLYLCSDEADFARPPTPTPKRTKAGPRFFAPDKAHLWPIGVRMGAALRAARARYEEAIANGSYDPRKPPHIRAAHWQRFHIGPRTAQERRVRVRWVFPTLVNCGPGAVLPAVVRPVN